MTSPFDDFGLATKIRELIKQKGVTLRDISNALDVPYRTVQNYLGGENRIPATFFLQLCHFLHVEADFFIYNDFRPERNDFYDAVTLVLTELGYLQPSVPSDQPNWAEQHTRRVTAAAEASAAIAARYDQLRRDSVFKKDDFIGGRKFGSREVGK